MRAAFAWKPGTLILLTVAFVAGVEPSRAQNADFSTAKWCQDDGTICWRDSWRSFSGVRFVVDLDASLLFQGGDNRWSGNPLNAFPKFAVEFSIYKSWIALQLALIGPGSVELDAHSPLRKKVTSPNAPIPHDWGFIAGLSFFDSQLAAGFGRVSYDKRVVRQGLQNCDEAAQLLDVEDTPDCLRRHDFRDHFGFLSFQPVSTLRSSLKGEDPNS